MRLERFAVAAAVVLSISPLKRDFASVHICGRSNRAILSYNNKTKINLPLTRSPLKLNGPPSSILMRALIFRTAGVSKSRSHPEEILPRRRTLNWRLQSEESVMLDRAFPQMLASLFIMQPVVAKQSFSDLAKRSIPKL